MKENKLIKNFKVYQIKIKNSDEEYFSRLFLEAKWLTNHILSLDNVFDHDTKVNYVVVKTQDNNYIRELTALAAQMKQGIFYQILDNVKMLSLRKKKGLFVGRLKFKSVINSIPLSNQSFKIKGNRVKFQRKKHWFKFFGLEQLGENPDIRCATLIRKPSGIYLHICVSEEIKPKKQTVSNIGMDFGIKDHFTFNNGTKVNFNADEQIKKIRKAQQNLSRKMKGSKNSFKAKLKLQREYERLDNMKSDASNKLISALSNFKVAFQDEMISGWQKGFFGKQVNNSILGRVKSMLQKNTDNVVLGKSLPTTQTCRECGRLNKQKLSERIYRCECGYKHDRDTHSAINMLWFSGLEQACVEKESDLWRVLSGIQSKHLSMKQEAFIEI